MGIGWLHHRLHRGHWWHHWLHWLVHPVDRLWGVVCHNDGGSVEVVVVVFVEGVVGECLLIGSSSTALNDQDNHDDKEDDSSRDSSGESANHGLLIEC